LHGKRDHGKRDKEDAAKLDDKDAGKNNFHNLKV